MFRKLSLAALLLVGVAATASAQLTVAGSAPVTVSAIKKEALTLNVAHSFTNNADGAYATIVEGSANAFNGQITLTPTWDLAASRTKVQVVATITTSLASGMNTIGNEYLQVKGGDLAAFSAFSATAGTEKLLREMSTAGGDRKVTGTEKEFTLDLQLVIPTSVEVVPGTYSGTITFQARAS